MDQNDGRESSSSSSSSRRQLQPELSSRVLRSKRYQRRVPSTRSGRYANHSKVSVMALDESRQQRSATSPRNEAGGDTYAVADEPPSSAFKWSVPALARAPTRHCAIRLLNVLFSEPFAPRLLLGEGAMDASPDFWRDVYEAFVSDTLAFDLVLTEHECVGSIDPSKVVAGGHPPITLKGMWRDVVQKHQRACTVMMANAKAKPSAVSMAKYDFFSFCRGRAEVYYLHCWLQWRPDLIGTVVAGGRSSPGPGGVVGDAVSPSAPPPPRTQAPSPASQHNASNKVEDEEESRLEPTRVVAPSSSVAPHSSTDPVEQEHINTQVQRQLIEVVDCIERLRTQRDRHPPGSVAYREISDEFHWFQARKRQLRARLDQ